MQDRSLGEEGGAAGRVEEVERGEVLQNLRDARTHEREHAVAVAGVGEAGVGQHWRRRSFAEVPDGDLGAVHAVDDEGAVHADPAEALRNGQSHGPMGRNAAVLVVPAGAVGQVDEERSGVAALVFVAQHDGPSVA